MPGAFIFGIGRIVPIGPVLILGSTKREFRRILQLQRSFHLLALKPRRHFSFDGVSVHLQRSSGVERVIADFDRSEIGVAHLRVNDCSVAGT